MPTQTVTVTLTNPDDDSEVDISGKSLDDDLGNSVVKKDTQIVEIFDGGDLEDDDDDDGPTTFVFEFFGKSLTDDDEFHLDLSGFDDDFNISVKSQDPGDSWIITGFESYTVTGHVWTFTYIGTDGQSHSMSIDVESTNGFGVATVVVCFARGTRIGTPTGVSAIENLAVGDLVQCGDGVARPIRWIGNRRVPRAELRANPRLRPVVLAPDALAPGRPDAPLRLSPQHRVLLRDWRAELLFGSPEVLAPAVALINDRDILRDQTCDPVDYFHLLVDGHHTVTANGVACETLMPADMALTALDGAARAEIFTVFPELAADLSAFGPTCRPVLKRFEQKILNADRAHARPASGPDPRKV